jgi:hypothetical protein
MKLLVFALTLLCGPAFSQTVQISPGSGNRRSTQPKLVTVNCNAVDLVPSWVTLTWPDVPTECTVAKLPPSGSTLLVENITAETVTYEVEALFVADGQRLELNLGSGVLAPHSAVTLPVTPNGYGVSLFDLDFSGSLFVQTATRNTAGVLVDRSYAPVVFCHQDVTGAVYLYGREARHTLYFAGDLKNRFFTSTPPASVMGVFDGGIGVGSAAEDFGPADGTGPANNGEWEFCMRWVYESIDSGFGEDYYQQGKYLKALVLMVLVDHPNWGSRLIF